VEGKGEATGLPKAVEVDFWGLREVEHEDPDLACERGHEQNCEWGVHASFAGFPDKANV
jgi:hypothetical protein